MPRLGPLAQQESGVLIRPRSGGQHTDGPPTFGGVPKWLKGAVLKTASGVSLQQEFESLRLRHNETLGLILVIKPFLFNNLKL